MTAVVDPSLGRLRVALDKLYDRRLGQVVLSARAPRGDARKNLDYRVAVVFPNNWPIVGANSAG